MPNWGPGCAAANSARQLHVDDANAAEAFDRKDAADRDRRQRRQIRSDRVERKFDVSLAAGIGAMRAGLRFGEGRRRDGFEIAQRDHARADPRLQFGGFAGVGDERAGRLIAGDFRGQRGDVAARLNAIGHANDGLRHVPQRPQRLCRMARDLSCLNQV